MTNITKNATISKAENSNLESFNKAVEKVTLTNNKALFEICSFEGEYKTPFLEIERNINRVIANYSLVSLGNLESGFVSENESTSDLSTLINLRDTFREFNNQTTKQ